MLSDEERARNRHKSKVRAKVEHVFGVMKERFGFRKVRYKGVAKNTHHLFVFCALVNLVMAKKKLLRRYRLVLRLMYGLRAEMAGPMDESVFIEARDQR